MVHLWCVYECVYVRVRAWFRILRTCYHQRHVPTDTKIVYTNIGFDESPSSIFLLEIARAVDFLAPSVAGLSSSYLTTERPRDLLPTQYPTNSIWTNRRRVRALISLKCRKTLEHVEGG